MNRDGDRGRAMTPLERLRYLCSSARFLTLPQGAFSAGRLRDLLASVHPGLERTVDVTTKTGLYLLTRYVTPARSARPAGPGCWRTCASSGTSKTRT